MEPASREFETHSPPAPATACAWERGVLPGGFSDLCSYSGLWVLSYSAGRAGMLGSRISRVRLRRVVRGALGGKEIPGAGAGGKNAGAQALGAWVPKTLPHGFN